ncbi:efflux RND transporter periplasmic adaptor subunit [Spongiimicrobium sp. 3-5]|uniref:efflux RND transporter periplasmic adaptor subunit n=1 Tax=Spongiimicrobium sp. 3-5 TaxID=3332596 RepID=UPI00397F9819
MVYIKALKFIALSIIVALLLGSCNTNEERILPTKTKITESVYSSVTVQPDSLYKVYAIVAGILEKNLVEEGDTVRRHDPIIQIVNATPKLNTENAKLQLQLAKENYSGKATLLSELKEQLSTAKLQLQNDSVNYYRQKNLWDQQIGSKVEYDNRKLAYELSQNNSILLKNKYQRTKNELETTLKQAENNYKTSLITTKDYSVESKINGTVYDLYKNTGEIVNTLEPLASVGSTNSFVIELLVDEVDIVKLRIGQKAIITLDAYKSDLFEATLSKIYPSKDERSQTFKVEALFDKAPDMLYPGLAGEGNIIVAKKNNALTIPNEYLIDKNKVLTDKGIVEVVTGLSNMDVVEIISGLDPDTYIQKPKE